jgi:hypothetical protein
MIAEIGAALGGVVFVAIGAAISPQNVAGMIRGVRSSKWPRTDAEVISSNVVRSRDAEGGSMYRVVVSYRFVLAGDEFRGSRVYFGDWMQLPSRRMAEKTARRFSAGSRVCVSYNPAQPCDCVLCPGFRWVLVYELAGGIIFAGFGVGLIAS